MLHRTKTDEIGQHCLFGKLFLNFSPGGSVEISIYKGAHPIIIGKNIFVI